MTQPLSCEQLFEADYPQLYELLVSELTDYAVFLMDYGGCLVSWNPGVERLFGYTEGEWLGQPAKIIFTPEDQSQGKPQEELSKAIRDGRAPDIRWHVRKDGSRLYVEGTLVALRDEAGLLLGFSKVMRDITERKERELQLQDAVAYAENIVDTMRVPMLVLDSSLRVRSANRSFYQTFRVSKEAIEHQLLHELGSGQWNIPALRELLERVLSQQTTVEGFEVEREFPGIGQKVMLLNARKIWREGSHTELILLTMEDVTAQRQAERERDRLTRELERSNEDLTMFAHTAAHDLQTPLRGVMSYTQLLQRRAQGKFDLTENEFARTIVESARHMQDLIQSLLHFAQVGQREFEIKPVPMETILDRALSHLKPQIQERQAQIKHTALPVVMGDSVQLIQLIENLIGNAIKYGRPGVRPNIEVSAHWQENRWVFAVRDNGEGIKPEHQDVIFEPLKRLHSADVPGTGMGLAVCRRIIERHGGHIWVESQPGIGSTFYFTLQPA
jgi:PAS domain S-box-containing protein